jgi:hypothetical protein
MVATQTVSILTREQLTAIGQAFFAAQATLENWACEPTIDDLVATILERRHRLYAVVAAAPDASFALQPNDAQGNVVWSAGQCADHVVNAQYGVCEPALLALMTPDGRASFEQPLPGDEIPDPPTLDRDAALSRLERAIPDYERLLDAVPRDPDLTITLDHRYFGTINLKAMLLIAAWHEQGHAAQIERLAT